MGSSPHHSTPSKSSSKTSYAPMPPPAPSLPPAPPPVLLPPSSAPLEVTALTVRSSDGWEAAGRDNDEGDDDEVSAGVLVVALLLLLLLLSPLLSLRRLRRSTPAVGPIMSTAGDSDSPGLRGGDDDDRGDEDDDVCPFTDPLFRSAPVSFAKPSPPTPPLPASSPNTTLSRVCSVPRHTRWDLGKGLLLSWALFSFFAAVRVVVVSEPSKEKASTAASASAAAPASPLPASRTTHAGVLAGLPPSATNARQMPPSCLPAMRNTSVSAPCDSACQSVDDTRPFLSPPPPPLPLLLLSRWPLASTPLCTEKEFAPRAGSVKGMPARRGPAKVELMPGSTLKGTPASERASHSPRLRPNTNGSPPFSRTTFLWRRPSPASPTTTSVAWETSAAFIESWMGAPGSPRPPRFPTAMNSQLGLTKPSRKRAETSAPRSS
mmetsp:Transcript_2032/g.4355  ORF Transcript_2032/g.4355 Transcript_2032/m.4355 type:complete len:434 (+) Transcript_2032:558-1859(+)